VFLNLLPGDDGHGSGSVRDFLQELRRAVNRVHLQFHKILKTQLAQVGLLLVLGRGGAGAQHRTAEKPAQDSGTPLNVADSPVESQKTCQAFRNYAQYSNQIFHSPVQPLYYPAVARQGPSQTVSGIASSCGINELVGLRIGGHRTSADDCTRPALVYLAGTWDLCRDTEAMARTLSSVKRRRKCVGMVSLGPAQPM